MKNGKSPKHPAFAQKLRQLRLSRGRTQQDLAAALGTTRNTYSSWEEGNARPKHEMGKRIAEFYNISVDGLYEDAVAFEQLKAYQQAKEREAAPVLTEPDETKTPAEAGGEKGEVLPDPTKPGIYQDLVQAMIRNSDALVRLTNAMLEERQYIRGTAKAIADIADKLGKQASLSEMQNKMDLYFQHDEQVDLFLARRIAALEKRPVEDLLDDLHNAMLDVPIEQNTHKTAGQHS